MEGLGTTDFGVKALRPHIISQLPIRVLTTCNIINGRLRAGIEILFQFYFLKRIFTLK